MGESLSESTAMAQELPKSRRTGEVSLPGTSWKNESSKPKRMIAAPVVQKTLVIVSFSSQASLRPKGMVTRRKTAVERGESTVVKALILKMAGTWLIVSKMPDAASRATTEVATAERTKAEKTRLRFVS